jgi:hypothetical protein
MVWEKLNVPPLSSILPKEDVGTWQKLLWGIIPFLTVLIAFLLNVQTLLIHGLKTKVKSFPVYFSFKNEYSKFSKNILKITHIWSIILALIIGFGLYQFYIKNESHYSPENAILAYYDALDFKELEKAHGLVNPKSDLSIAQFMLEISVTDGLLSSYAKLDAIDTEIISQTDSLARVKVNTFWITPLEKINKTYYKALVKVHGKWYLEPEDINADLPPDQLYASNTTNYFNQGRRRITTEQTHHEDVLKQPVLEILSAKLVKFQNHYAIVGEVQNIDNVPSDVVLKGTLYNDDNKALATYNAKYHVKHKLMPKEVSSFRINFEGIAWSKTKDAIPKTFNPDEFTPVEFEEQPTKFNLQAAGNVSGSDLFKSTTVSISEINNKHISGSLFNGGAEEVTIPQLLVSYYDNKENLMWVDHLFVDGGIRQQRKQPFEYGVLDLNTLQTINDDMANCFVNGLPNKDISNKIVANRIINHTSEELQTVNHHNYKYIKLEVNTYIGNPN